MDKIQIEEAIGKAKRGIFQYLEIMDLLSKVNVAENEEFQRKYNAFYRVRQRSAEWYRTYYSFMQESKGQKPTFECVLNYMHRSLNRCEPSFSSKLVATLNPEEPIWDTFVLKNLKIKVPPYSDKNRIKKTDEAYKAIQDWYMNFLSSAEGRLVIGCFNKLVDNHSKITNIKKVDFVLWQTRT
jgi:hypothetical protein